MTRRSGAFGGFRNEATLIVCVHAGPSIVAQGRNSFGLVPCALIAAARRTVVAPARAIAIRCICRELTNGDTFQQVPIIPAPALNQPHLPARIGVQFGTLRGESEAGMKKLWLLLLATVLAASAALVNATGSGASGSGVSTDVKVWIGLKNSDDVGTSFDLKAEVTQGSNEGYGSITNFSGG